MERIPEFLSRLDRLERDMVDLQRSWHSTVDDIKAIIKSEISDLKSEQIKDLKDAIRAREIQIAEVEDRIRDMEMEMREWDAGRGVVGWLVKTGLTIGGLTAGYFGAKHIG